MPSPSRLVQRHSKCTLANSLHRVFRPREGGLVIYDRAHVVPAARTRERKYQHARARMRAARLERRRAVDSNERLDELAPKIRKPQIDDDGVTQLVRRLQ